MAVVDPRSLYLVLFDSLALIIPRHALPRSFSEHAILKTLKSHSFAVKPANLSLFYGVLNVVRFSHTPRDARFFYNVTFGLILVLVYDQSPRRSSIIPQPVLRKQVNVPNTADAGVHLTITVQSVLQLGVFIKPLTANSRYL